MDSREVWGARLTSTDDCVHSAIVLGSRETARVTSAFGEGSTSSRCVGGGGGDGERTESELARQ